jgi:uncharacterized protein DUF3592
LATYPASVILSDYCCEHWTAMPRVVSTAVVMALGLAAVGGGIYFLRHVHRMARAAGAIVDFERHFTGKTAADFPVVSFRTLDGAEVRTMVRQGRVLSRPKVGTQVRVFYDPADPADALIGSAAVRFGGIVYLVFELSLLAMVAVSVL